MADGLRETPAEQVFKELEVILSLLQEKYEGLAIALHQSPLRADELSLPLHEAVEVLLAAQRQLELAGKMLGSVPPEAKPPET